MKRIAVLSDTHDHLPGAAITIASTADEIWHLGDVVREDILEALRALAVPMRVVRGNCDDCLDWPYCMDFDCEGFQVRLIHIPPSLPPPGVDLLLHGHTHVPRNQKLGPCRFLNPGTCGGPGKGAPSSMAILTLADGAAPGWELKLL